MRRFAALLLGTSLVLLPACGDKTDETTRAPGITPANALALVSVNLDPSIEQKRKLLGIARRFPGAREKVKGDFEEGRDELLADLLKGTGLNFERDVKPWLGNELALAVLPPAGDGPPLIVALVESKDDDKARATIDKASAAGDFDGAYRVVGDFVVISDQPGGEVDDKAPLDLIAAQAGKDDGGLAKSAAFTEVVDRLAGDRLVLAWADLKDSAGLLEGMGGFPPLDYANRFKDAETVAMDLHAEDAALVFEGVAKAPAAGDGDVAELTRSLPRATLAALTLFDFGTGLTEGLQSFVGGRGGPDLAAELEQATGLDLEADILSWMAGELVLVAGGVREGSSFPDFALVVEPTDEAKARAGVEKVRQALAGQGVQVEERQVAGASAYVTPGPLVDGIQPAMALFPDRFVLASHPDYLAQLAKGESPGLADSDAYKSVLAEGDDVTMQFVALIDPIREAFEKVVYTDADERAEYERETKPNVEPLSAFGIVARQDGKLSRLAVTLTFD